MLRLPSWRVCIGCLLIAAIFAVYRNLEGIRSPVFSDVPASARAAKERKIVLEPDSIAYRVVESGMATSASAPSLEMRENVDFLLTPALLVQQAISDDVIITYPEE